MLYDQRSLKDYELPRLTALAPNLIGASFFLMKLLPARYMLDRAEYQGELGSGGHICETTSGTFGLALAMLAAIRGYQLTLFSDNAIDPSLQQRLCDLGTHLMVVKEPAAKGGFQQARLDKLNDYLAEHPRAFCPRQYDNPYNPSAYALVAEQISERVGSIDCLIGTVGSGGSMSGLSGMLRQLNPELKVIGIDTPASVVFGQPDGPRFLRGLGNSLVPKNVHHTQFDEVHWVTAAEAYQATRELHRNHALFQGGTSGAAYLVARWWAKNNPDQQAVVIFPDEGHRYVNTIYSDDYLHMLDGWSPHLPVAPCSVANPKEPIRAWSYYQWQRQSLIDAVNARKVAYV